MAKTIIITNKVDHDSTRLILMNAEAYSSIFSDVSLKLENEYPETYKKSFFSSGWGEIHIDYLDSAEFQIVHRLLQDEHERFLNLPDKESDPTLGELPEIWAELMCEMNGDPRLTSSENSKHSDDA